MTTYMDIDGSARKGKSNHVVDNIIPQLGNGKRTEAEKLYERCSSECVEAAMYIDEVDELVEKVDGIEKCYLAAGAVLLEGKNIDILTKGHHDINPVVKNAAYRSMNNGGLVIMSSEEERSVDSFAKMFGIEKYEKVCSRLSEKDGKLTGKFEKVVSAKDKRVCYKGGAVYVNGINDIGVIVDAIRAGSQVNICDADNALLVALDNLEIKKSVQFIN